MVKLSAAQITEFYDQGYLIIENALTEQDLAPTIAEIEALVDLNARKLYDDGKIHCLYEEKPFEERYAYIYHQCNEIVKGIDIMYSRLPSVFHFLRNNNLLEVVQSLLGSEILCSPIHHIRAKVPKLTKKTGDYYFQYATWHQDAIAIAQEAYPYNIFTFWIPLINATEQTGCMEIIPYIFKKGLLNYCNIDGVMTIAPEEIISLPSITAPCSKGGIVIMNKYTPHRGLPNTSDIVRWSLDLRYQQIDTPTGRSFYPSTIVRSISHPERVQDNYLEWCTSWENALLQSKRT